MYEPKASFAKNLQKTRQMIARSQAFKDRVGTDKDNESVQSVYFHDPNLYREAGWDGRPYAIVHTDLNQTLQMLALDTHWPNNSMGFVLITPGNPEYTDPNDASLEAVDWAETVLGEMLELCETETPWDPGEAFPIVTRGSYRFWQTPEKYRGRNGHMSGIYFAACILETN